jgi:hypothetical protein
MKTSIIITSIVIAAAVSAMGIASTLSGIQMAHARPTNTYPGHGSCLIGGPGATTGCAGDQGGFVRNPIGRCHTTGGPNNEQFSCP